MMKRVAGVPGLLSALAVCAVALLPLACDSSGRDGGAGSDGKMEYPLAAHHTDTYSDDLPGLKERKYVRVLTTFNRTNFFLSGAKPYGFEYSLMKDYEKFLNRGAGRRELKVVVEFIPVSREELIPALLEGRGDIAAAGLTVTEERLREVDFTTPYLTGIDEVVVAHEDVEGLESVEDLAGRSVFVRRSSSYYESLVALNSELEKKGLDPVEVMEADETLETEDILEMVNSGAVDITVADSHIAEAWAGVLEDLRAYPGITLREGGSIAWGVRKGNPELRASLDRFVRTRRKGTLIGNVYFNRYFKDTKWIQNPLVNPQGGTVDEQIRLAEEQTRLFKEYAGRYGFDWTLVKALAFQESGLDQGRRSRAGAVGIMQIKPSTAKDRSVGIKDVTTLEGNIHAGVKYLAHLRDTYFDEPGLRERDRVRFTLAAYNAGPGNVRRARRLAAKMGLDPDRWFRNVEMAMLRIIGQETVRYVSNINKYYVLLNLDFKNRKIRAKKKSSP